MEVAGEVLLPEVQNLTYCPRDQLWRVPSHLAPSTRGDAHWTNGTICCRPSGRDVSSVGGLSAEAMLARGAPAAPGTPRRAGANRVARASGPTASPKNNGQAD